MSKVLEQTLHFYILNPLLYPQSTSSLTMIMGQ
jgi:hypothetical protein